MNLGEKDMDFGFTDGMFRSLVDYCDKSLSDRVQVMDW